MRKKKLSVSDLIREEVHNTEDLSTPSVESQKQPDEVKTTSSISRRDRAATNQSEDKIKELTLALESAEQRAQSLESQAIDLESEIEKQKNLVETLKSQLQQKTELETELKEQKELVYKLYSELDKVQSVLIELEEQKQLVEKLSLQLEETRSMTLSTEKSPSKAISLSRIQTRPIERFVATNQSPTILSNEDIGWFD